MKKILPILVTTALLALLTLALDARAQAPTMKYPSGYTPPPPAQTPKPEPVPIEKRTGLAYIDALRTLPDYPLKQHTPNLLAYTGAAWWLVRFITEDLFQDRGKDKANWTLESETMQRAERCSLTIHDMEMWWDGMDSDERDQARKYNEWIVERLKKDGKPVPGIFRTINNRKP